MPLGLALLGAEFTGERRGWAVGIYSAITGLSMILGPVLGGVITEGLAWRWVFWLNVPIGIVRTAGCFIGRRSPGLHR
jgi:MFS family permease